MPRREWANYRVFVGKARKQVCKRCGAGIERHRLTPLGDVICRNLPKDAGVTRYEQHRFKYSGGSAYRSIRELVDALNKLLKKPDSRDNY